MKIGKYLIQKGLINQKQVDEVLKEQIKKDTIFRNRFGRIAINKGFITEKMLNQAILEKYQTENQNKKKNNSSYSFLKKQ
jgi:uncharacterized protein YtpQ (UPF0354 family)